MPNLSNIKNEQRFSQISNDQNNTNEQIITNDRFKDYERNPSVFDSVSAFHFEQSSFTNEDISNTKKDFLEACFPDNVSKKSSILREMEALSVSGVSNIKSSVKPKNNLLEEVRATLNRRKMMHKEMLATTEMRDENGNVHVIAQSETNLSSIKGLEPLAKLKGAYEESESNATFKTDSVVSEIKNELVKEIQLDDSATSIRSEPLAIEIDLTNSDLRNLDSEKIDSSVRSEPINESMLNFDNISGIQINKTENNLNNRISEFIANKSEKISNFENYSGLITSKTENILNKNANSANKGDSSIKNDLSNKEFLNASKIINKIKKVNISNSPSKMDFLESDLANELKNISNGSILEKILLDQQRINLAIQSETLNSVKALCSKFENVENIVKEIVIKNLIPSVEASFNEMRIQILGEVKKLINNASEISNPKFSVIQKMLSTGKTNQALQEFIKLDEPDMKQALSIFSNISIDNADSNLLVAFISKIFNLAKKNPKDIHFKVMTSALLDIEVNLLSVENVQNLSVFLRYLKQVYDCDNEK